MIEKVEGFVVGVTPYSDTSKIINIFTKDHGIIGVMCKGARSVKSKLRAVSEKFVYGNFHIYYKENKLSTLIAVDVMNHLKTIKSDILLISYLNYLTELTTQVYKHSNSEEIYELFINSVLKIEEGLNPLIITNIIEVKYLDYLGVGLNLEACSRCGNKKNIVTLNADSGGYICSSCLLDEPIVDAKTVKMIRMYYLVLINSITKIDISINVQEEINDFLDRYYERYTGLYLKSKKFLKSLDQY